jgi:hypothetical protein
VDLCGDQHAGDEQNLRGQTAKKLLELDQTSSSLSGLSPKVLRFLSISWSRLTAPSPCR